MNSDDRVPATVPTIMMRAKSVSGASPTARIASAGTMVERLVSTARPRMLSTLRSTASEAGTEAVRRRIR